MNEAQVLQDIHNIKNDFNKLNARVKLLEEESKANEHSLTSILYELKLMNEGKKIIKAQEKKVKEEVQIKGFPV